MKYVLKETFENYGMSYEEFFSSIDITHKDQWVRSQNKIEFTEIQNKLIISASNPINILIITADWCGDSARSVPIFGKMSQISPYVNVRLIRKDDHPEFVNQYAIGGKNRIPFVLFLDQDFNEIMRWIEKSTFNYNLIYQAKLITNGLPKEEYSSVLRALYKENSLELAQENMREIFEALERTYYLVNLSSFPSRKEKLSPQMINRSI